MNISTLRTEVKKRQDRREATRKKINRLCRSEYGLEDFFGLADRMFFQFLDKNHLNVCLFRQVPTINIEHLAFSLFVEWLNQHNLPARPVSAALGRDCFKTINPYKMSLVRLPLLHRGRKGLVVQNRMILSQAEKIDFENRILNKLKTISGESLPQFHGHLRQAILCGDSGLTMDLSLFIQQCLFQNIANQGRIQPRFVYLDQRGRDKRFDPREVNFSNGSDPRPPAEWYYFLYLLLFIDGTCALVSTVDEDPTVIKWFAESIKKIEKACGLPPLIIDAPLKVKTEEWNSNLLEIPRWVMEDQNWRRKINQPPDDRIKFYEAVEFFEKQLIGQA